MERKSLTERYRPTQWADVVGQDKALKSLELIRNRGGLAGRAYWLAGQPGTGKTTIAKLIADEVADEYDTIELNASIITGPAMVLEFQAMARTYGMGPKRGRAIIINEAHGLRRNVIRTLLDALEPVPNHAVWLFTTTRAGEASLFEDYDDASPLLSRCTVLPLAPFGNRQAFAEHAKRIAAAEGLDGKPLTSYETLLKKHSCNLRAALSEIEAGVMVL
jgi:replication-associated recombination protein RarA